MEKEQKIHEEQVSVKEGDQDKLDKQSETEKNKKEEEIPDKKIDCLDKKPGIFSARWAGAKGDFKKAIKRVYRELNKKDKHWKKKKIKARFVCALSICYFDRVIASVIGKIEGSISTNARGKNGFGYDPIFIPKNKKKTFGEMKSSNKYRIDHRSIAFKKIKKFL